MSPGRRAVIVAFVVAAPVAAILYYRAESGRLDGMRDDLASYAASPGFSAIRDKCRDVPVNLGPGPASGAAHDGPPYEIYAYDGGFAPAQGGAPVFSDRLSEDMRGKITAFGLYSSPNGTGVELGMATPWKMGSCALILVRMPARPGDTRDETIRSGLIAAAAGIVAGLASYLLKKRVKG